ncbi:MAG: hypothetical protein ACOH2H_13500 [Cypionkella sp.]
MTFIATNDCRREGAEGFETGIRLAAACRDTPVFFEFPKEVLDQVPSFCGPIPLQTHEMLLDAHWHGFRVFGGVPERGIYDNLWTSPAARWFHSAHAAGMHESIRPFGGAVPPLALMGVRGLSPNNMIGLAGLVVNQALRRRSLSSRHQLPTRNHHRVSGDSVDWPVYGT